MRVGKYRFSVNARFQRKKLQQLLTCFLMKWPMRLQKVTGLKSADCVLFMSRNIKRMPGGIRKLGKGYKWLLKNYRFLNVG